uniref:Endo/exonuclease/phosphatase domain-containing protein n=1 Tax=Elaeophora elaphi TaxID=1147741 RepID=A0A158Q6W2_9BILA
MNNETDQEVELLGVQKFNTGGKTDEERDIADLDVILLTDEESSPRRQENLSKDKSEDLKVIGEAGPSFTRPQERAVERVQSETRICAINQGEQSRLNRADPRNFPSARSLPSSASSLHATNMPEFVDLLTQGTLLMCKKWLRRWDVVQNGVVGGNPLRICSYNVLCQQTACKTPELYIHLTKPGRAYELTWENRWRLLAREFSMIAADIFCLQEVQYDHYDHFFRPYFEAAGFLGTYKKRTHSLIDGCAIFYKADFQMLRYRYIEYYVSNDSVLDRDNVGQLIRLKDMRNGREFCIANTHLLFNKRRGDVKLAQLAVLLANIDKECGPESGQECPYVLCGDFNIQPYSPLYNFIMSGEICFTNLRRGDVSGQGSAGGPFVSVNLLPEDVEIDRNCRFKYLKNRTVLLPSANCWSHPLCFNSVYHHVNAESGQSMSSTVGNVSEKEIRLIRRLSLPNINQLAGTLGPWPNSATPSDHIPLIADFVLQ